MSPGLCCSSCSCCLHVVEWILNPVVCVHERYKAWIKTDRIQRCMQWDCDGFAFVFHNAVAVAGSSCWALQRRLDVTSMDHMGYYDMNSMTFFSSLNTDFVYILNPRNGNTLSHTRIYYVQDASVRLSTAENSCKDVCTSLSLSHRPVPYEVWHITLHSRLKTGHHLGRDMAIDNVQWYHRM